MTIKILCLFAGISVNMFVIFIFCVLYNKNAKNINDWLFSGINDYVYNIFFKNQEPQNVAKFVGIELDKYAKNCNLLKIDTNLKTVIVFRIYGINIIFLGIILSLFIDILFLPISLGLSLLFISGPIQKIDKEAKQRKIIIENELPRFLDLLETALQIKMPIEQAIVQTAKYLDGYLSEEFLLAMVEANIGISGWQKALENLAIKYDIDIFTDFVMEFITAYNKGTDIYEIVCRKNRDIKQTHILSVKERASKTTSTILVPVFICKIVPILALLVIPVLLQLENGF